MGGEGIKVVTWAVRVFSPLGFTAVVVDSLIFKGIFFFYSMDKKLELSLKVTVTTVLQLLKGSVRITKRVLCEKCRIETSVVKWFFNPYVGCGSLWQHIVLGCTLLPFLLA